MTRLAAITALAHATASRKLLIEALRTVDAYAGHSRDGMKDLRAHALAVHTELNVVEEKPADEPATKGQASRARSHTRTARPATVRRMAVAVASVTADEQGVIVLTAEAVVAAGLGKCWVRTSNRTLADTSSMHHATFAACGYTAVATRGTLVLTPIAIVEAQAVA